MVLEIPAQLVEALRLPPEEKSPRLHQEARMSEWEFHLLLGKEGIVRRYDVEELEEDLRTLETLD